MKYLQAATTMPMDLKETLAKEYLGIDTLVVQKRDHLDFHEVGVVSVAKALDAAYQAGIAFAANQV